MPAGARRGGMARRAAQWVRRGNTGGPCNVAAWRSADGPPAAPPRRAFIASVAADESSRLYATVLFTTVFTIHIFLATMILNF